MAFWLGKKSNESQTHKWTVYVRGATNEDLGVVIKRVVFQLHPSFDNPLRVVESPPFELSEFGWGEFEIAISIVFHADVCDKQLTLFHHLKLYAEDEFGPLATKEPAVMESYDEIVFLDPLEAFFANVKDHPVVNVPKLPATFGLPPGKVLVVPCFRLLLDNYFEHRFAAFCVAVPIAEVNEKKRSDTKDHLLSQWFMNFSDTDELLKLAAARQKVMFDEV